MEIIESIPALNEALTIAGKSGNSIGFVPTMGALHEGHMALVRRARQVSDVVVVSVFVNPTQFNNPDDLKLYPRTPEKDAALLKKNGCDIAFFPSVTEVYPADYQTPEVPLGNLDAVMEGEFRPGHFRGVVQVVNRFFEVIRPQKAFFGLKDFQQVAVIRHMVRFLELPVEIVPCPTLRETTGLAMSSRNVRLSGNGKADALTIYRSLMAAKEKSADHSPAEIMLAMKEAYKSSPLELEYFTIVHPDTLEPLADEWVPGATACVAAYCEGVRLIDNMTLTEQTA